MVRLLLALSVVLIAPLSWAEHQIVTEEINLQQAIVTNESLTFPDGISYYLQSTPFTEEQINLFGRLNENEQAEFFRVRNRNISLLVRALHKQPALVGRLVEIDGVTYRWKIAIKNAVRKVREKWGRPSTAPIDLDEPSTLEGLNRVELGHDAIQKIITDFDTDYWNKSPIIAKPAEMRGGIFTVATALGLGSLRLGGLSAWQFGVGMGFNKVSRQVYLETFFIRESYDKAYTYAATGYLGLHGGIRSELDRHESGLVRLDRTGNAAVLPIGILHSNADSHLAVTGVGFELSMVLFWLRYLQLYKTKWHERGYRLYFKVPKVLSGSCSKLLSGK